MKEIDIGWCINSDRFTIAFDAPSRLIPTKDQSQNKRGFLSCPAVRNFSEGLFQIVSPFSLKLRVIESEDGFSIVPVYPFTSLTEDLVKQFIQIEPQDTWPNRTTAVVQIPSPYVFFSDTQVIIKQFSPELSVKSKMNWRVIPGQFNIYAWQRPLNWAFEWDITCGDFEIRAGEPQYNIQFISLDIPHGGYEINLNRQILDTPIKDRLNLTKDVAKVRRGTMQLFAKAAALRSQVNLINLNPDD